MAKAAAVPPATGYTAEITLVATVTLATVAEATLDLMSYREWVGPPPSWWVLSALFSLSWLLAVGFYLGPLAGALAFLGSTGLVTALLLGLALRLRLDGSELRVGRAVLDLAYVSGIRSLDVDSTAARTGPRSDARAHLVLRPYAKTAVELTLDDPADPVPYWLISTRRPGPLAEAVGSVLAAGSSRLTR